MCTYIKLLYYKNFLLHSFRYYDKEHFFTEITEKTKGMTWMKGKAILWLDLQGFRDHTALQSKVLFV